MKNLRPYLIFDRNINSKKIKNKLIKKISKFSFKQSNFIIVIGGDGFMLQTLKKYYKKKNFLWN